MRLILTLLLIGFGFAATAKEGEPSGQQTGIQFYAPEDLEKLRMLQFKSVLVGSEVVIPDGVFAIDAGETCSQDKDNNLKFEIALKCAVCRSAAGPAVTVAGGIYQLTASPGPFAGSNRTLIPIAREGGSNLELRCIQPGANGTTLINRPIPDMAVMLGRMKIQLKVKKFPEAAFRQRFAGEPEGAAAR